MRSRERLCEVLATAGPCLGEAVNLVLAMAHDRLREEPGYILIQLLEVLAENHESPHIRELASEALHHILSDTSEQAPKEGAPA